MSKYKVHVPCALDIIIKAESSEGAEEKAFKFLREIDLEDLSTDDAKVYSMSWTVNTMSTSLAEN